ncbi:MAG: 50S ribosomal protein L21 [Vampirovibrionales bacterium]|nr:50S ribosomal protein L21 [Vampirovibrionales bacterium]
MYAIVELNGKQYQVEKGRYIVVDRLSQAPDEIVAIDNVLMVVNGDQSLVGAPFVSGAHAVGKVLTHFRGPKVLVYKMRCKKGYRLKNGHRQEYTRLQIDDLTLPGETSSSAKPKAKAASKKAAAPESESEQAPATSEES